MNVAARLEALCDPGGLCISRSANEQVHNKLSLAFADLGEQTGERTGSQASRPLRPQYSLT